ncbi:hypothetical protein V2J09_016699 [Rumex salicifolius]
MEIPSAKTVVSAAASAAATVVLIRSIARDLLPYEIQDFFRHKIFFLFSSMSSKIVITIDECEGLYENQLFQAAEVYLGTKISPSTHRFRAAIPAKETKIILSMDKNQEVVDVFNGVQLKWTKVNKQVDSKFTTYDDSGSRTTSKTDISHFELSFHKKHRQMVFDSYFPHIVSEALKFKEEKKTLKIHTLKYDRMLGGSGHPWVSVNLDHPATFDTLAMDLDMKKTIMEDLEMFVMRKEFYRKVGKAWKRGYLLYGPPGTGKSSLIAAMANFLNFDIYDLELTDLSYNSELRKLLIGTANRSILVVEDIDCSIDLERNKQRADQSRFHPAQEASFYKLPKTAHYILCHITLSGLLNFIDGLWSSCGDERIIIFTTNHKERLDPVLLRPGRMDVHIHMSYCTPCGFKVLASNYLGVTDHPLFLQVEDLMPEAKVTPAEVGEQLMKTEDSEMVLNGLVEFLKGKKEENELKANCPDKEDDEGEIVEDRQVCQQCFSDDT